MLLLASLLGGWAPAYAKNDILSANYPWAGATAGKPVATAPAISEEQKILEAIRVAAQGQGVSFAYLLAQAEIESGLNPSAKATNSSAAGLFQFVEATWIEAVARLDAGDGPAVPVGVRGLIAAGDRPSLLRLRHDPVIASLVAANFAKENAARLRGVLGRDATDSELYLAHFLGSGGARQFLGVWMRNRHASAAALLPDAARANRPIFYSNGGVARSLDDVKAVLEGKMQRAAAMHETTIAAMSAKFPVRNENASGTDPVRDGASAASPNRPAVGDKDHEANGLTTNAFWADGYRVQEGPATSGVDIDGIPADVPRTQCVDPGGCLAGVMSQPAALAESRQCSPGLLDITL